MATAAAQVARVNPPPTPSIMTHFADLPDPRSPLGRRHMLTDLLTIAICAVVCGADYISSIGGCDAKRMAGLIRGHWAVENQLHWQLDVSFREDDRRVRVGHAAENFSRLCRIALNLLQRDHGRKLGVRTKRLKAGWDNDYLLSLLSG